jgi:hypothetical protein
MLGLVKVFAAYLCHHVESWVSSNGWGKAFDGSYNDFVRVPSNQTKMGNKSRQQNLQSFEEVVPRLGTGDQRQLHG